MTPDKQGLLARLPAPPEGRTGWPWTEETPPGSYDESTPWPRITIVTPSYNQGDYLEECLRSVLLQNYPDLEFIVMDGGSTDESRRLLELYGPWLSYWQSAPDGGQSRAINLGFSRATGMLRGWINSDDYYTPGSLARVSAAAAAHPFHDLFYGDEYILENDRARCVQHRQVFRFQVMVGGAHLPSHTTFWRQRVQQPVDESLKFIMDAVLFKKMAAQGARPHHIPEPLGTYRVHTAAKSSTMLDIAKRETQEWSAKTPWYYAFLWQAHLVLAHFQRRFSRI